MEDTTAPEFTVPADYTSSSMLDVISDELLLEEATATDNCATCEDSFDFTSTVEGYTTANSPSQRTGGALTLVASHEGD